MGLNDSLTQCIVTSSRHTSVQSIFMVYDLPHSLNILDDKTDSAAASFSPFKSKERVLHRAGFFFLVSPTQPHLCF